MAHDASKIKLQDNIRLNFRGKVVETTLGRVLFNEIFPEDFTFQNEPMTKKKLSQVMGKVYQKYGQAVTANIADHLKDVGFHYATKSGLSVGMGDFAKVEGMEELLEQGESSAAAISEQYDQGFITEEERYRLTVDNWTKIDNQVQDNLSKQFETDESTMSIAITSGARGNIAQMKMSVGMLGVSQTLQDEL